MLFRWVVLFLLTYSSAAIATTYPSGVGCEDDDDYLDRSVVAGISDRFMANPTVSAAYDLITLWDDIPSKEEAKNWSKRPLSVQPEDAEYQYWEMKVTHERVIPVKSTFCGTQHVVKVTLPDTQTEARNKVFQTKLGLVQQKAANSRDYYHGVFSREGFQDMYNKYATSRGLDPKNISKVDLLTAGKMDKTARWAIMSIYVAYIDGSEVPDFYAMEGAKATGVLPLNDTTDKPSPPGEPGSTFYIANDIDEGICSDQGCPHGYAYTPFSNEHNTYKTKVWFYGNQLDQFQIQSYSQHDSKAPYFSLFSRLYPLTLDDDKKMIDGTALHMEAVFRVFALANAFDWDMVEPQAGGSSNLVELAGVAIANNFISVANDALRLLGQAFTLELPWYIQPAISPDVEARNWLEASKGTSEHLKNLATDFPSESVNGCNAVYADYGPLQGTDAKSIGRLFEANANAWIELNPPNTFVFQETRRDEWSVYLNDSSRDVQLDVDLFKRQIFYADKETERRPQYRIIKAKRDPSRPLHFPVKKLIVNWEGRPPETFVRSNEVAGGKNAGQPVWYNWVGGKLKLRWEQTPQSDENTIYLYQRDQLHFWHKFDLKSNEWSEVLNAEQTQVNTLGQIVEKERTC